MNEPINNNTGQLCRLCGGTGQWLIPAHQLAGEIIDDQWVECQCEDEETDGEDY